MRSMQPALFTLAAAAAAPTALAWAPPQQHTQLRLRLRNNGSSSSRLFAEPTAVDDEIAALRAAAAKARQEAEKLSAELGKPLEPETVITTKSAQENVAAVASLFQAGDLDGWKQLQTDSAVFGSANLKTFPMSMEMLTSRTGLTAGSLGLANSAASDAAMEDLKYATLFVALGSTVLGVLALAVLPPNIGATLCYLVALVPVAFLGVGSTAPGIITNAIAEIKSSSSSSDDSTTTNNASPKQRRVRHEAAHLCCGYFCGLPVTSYSVDDNDASVEFGAAAVSSSYSPTQVAALAVTGLAGCVGEALEWGTADGAAGDLQQLEQVFRRGSDFYGAQAQQDITRWAAFTASQLLRTNKEKYEKVLKAMETKAPLEDCVAILEG